MIPFPLVNKTDFFWFIGLQERHRQLLAEQEKDRQMLANLKLVYTGQGHKNAAEHLQKQAERECQLYTLSRQRRAQASIRSMIAARKERHEKQKQEAEWKERQKQLEQARSSYGRKRQSSTSPRESQYDNRQKTSNTYPVASHFNINHAERIEQGGSLAKQTYHRWSYAVVQHGSKEEENPQVNINHNDPYTKSSTSFVGTSMRPIPGVVADTSQKTPEAIKRMQRQRALRKQHVRHISDECRARRICDTTESELAKMKKTVQSR